MEARAASPSARAWCCAWRRACALHAAPPRLAGGPAALPCPGAQADGGITPAASAALHRLLVAMLSFALAGRRPPAALQPWSACCAFRLGRPALSLVNLDENYFRYWTCCG